MKGANERSFQFYVTTAIVGLWAYSLVIVYSEHETRIPAVVIAAFALCIAYLHCLSVPLRMFTA